MLDLHNDITNISNFSATQRNFNDLVGSLFELQFDMILAISGISSSDLKLQ